FRFFPGFYFHVRNTMSRIPRGGGASVADSLVPTPEITLAFANQPPFVLPADLPAANDLAGWIRALNDLVHQHLPQSVPDSEKLFFLRRLLCFLVSGRKRRELVYDTIDWWTYIDAANKSQGYQDILANGLTRSLVAMQPKVGSTLTVGTILVQVLLDMFDTHAFSDCVLNGPTSDVWITPWVARLQQLGGANFELHCGHRVDSLNFNPGTGKITGIRVTDLATSTQTTVGTAADDYIAALPVDVMQTLLTQGIKAAAGLDRIDQLQVESMNGVLYYVNHNAGERHGHVIYINSSWAVTSIEQQQFWADDIGTTYGAPGAPNPARDIVSAIISDWKSPGQYTTMNTAEHCVTRNEVLNEAWAQIKAHRSTWTAGYGKLEDADKVNQWLDEAITIPGPGGVAANSEPLLVNVTGTHALRPDAATAIDNLFLASDYVKTYTDLATMEAANEAGRRAAIGVLQRANPNASNLPEVRPLHEPAVFRALQDLDDILFDFYGNDPAHAPPLCAVIDALSDEAFSVFARSGGAIVPAAGANTIAPKPIGDPVRPNGSGRDVVPPPPDGAGTAAINWLIWVLLASNLVLLALLIYVLLAD
ncbi:MAG: FAD-dependent oxidoreductase, partial [Alphaproteobacteria bacterium]